MLKSKVKVGVQGSALVMSACGRASHVLINSFPVGVVVAIYNNVSFSSIITYFEFYIDRVKLSIFYFFPQKSIFYFNIYILTPHKNFPY